MPFLKIYTEYVNGFEKATKLVDKLETNAKIKAFFDVCAPVWMFFFFFFHHLMAFHLIMSPLKRSARGDPSVKV